MISRTCGLRSRQRSRRHSTAPAAPAANVGAKSGAAIRSRRVGRRGSKEQRNGVDDAPSRRLLLRQRSIPRSSRTGSPQSPAKPRESPQWWSQKAMLTAESPAYPCSARKRQDRPVTPEVAGSSPVAPAQKYPAKPPLVLSRKAGKPQSESIVCCLRRKAGHDDRRCSSSSG
jgi:hypothetical protein